MNRLLVFVAKHPVAAEQHARIAGVVREAAALRGLATVGSIADRRLGVALMCRDSSTSERFAAIHDRAGVVTAAEGYLYNRPEVAKALDLPELVALSGDAEVMAESIRTLGRHVVETWQGHYTALRYDRATGDVIIATDRYGLKPLYVAETAEHWIYSHDLKLMLDVFPIPRALDRAAAAQLVSMELLYEDRTLVEAVRRLPNAAVVEVSRDKVTTAQYWDYPFHEQRYLSDRRDVLERLKHHLDHAIGVEYSKMPESTAVALSGGMDSRLIVAYAHRHRAPLNTFTVASPKHFGAEQRCARRVAEAVGARWDSVDRWESLDVAPLWREFVTWTGGWQSVYQSWMHPTYRAVCPARGYRRVLTGYAFDAQLAFNSKLGVDHDIDFSATIDRICNIYRIDHRAVAPYVSGSFARDLENVSATLADRLVHLRGARPAEIADYFLWTARVRTYTAADAHVHRSLVNVGFPFLEYELFDLCMKTPATLKNGHGLYFQLFLEEFGPLLGAVPYAGTGTRIDRDPRLRQRLRHVLERASYLTTRLTRGRLERCTSPAAFFRHRPELRRSILAVLEGGRAVAAGILAPDGVDRLVAGIDEGKDYLLDVLTQLATVELCLQEILEA